MFSEASVCFGGGGRSAVSFVVGTYELLEHEEELFQQSYSTLVIREPTALITKKQQVSLKIITHSVSRRNPLKFFGSG